MKTKRIYFYVYVYEGWSYIRPNKNFTLFANGSGLLVFKSTKERGSAILWDGGLISGCKIQIAFSTKLGQRTHRCEVITGDNKHWVAKMTILYNF